MTRDRKTKSVELVDSLFQISLFLQRSGNRNIARFGLNQSQFTVLREITEKTDLSQKDILGDFLLEKSNLSKIIKKLVELGFVTVRTPEDDRRMTILNSTDKGRAIIREIVSELDAMKDFFDQPLETYELESALSSVRRLKELVRFHIHDSRGSKGERDE
ncbi:MAG: MarR family transcriptional regulator [Spirochaetaceae bacterium]|nr:MarR family transcriptional regulator [Spirochaetaceae bacterium]